MLGDNELCRTKKKKKQENYGINMRFTKDKANNENYNI